MKDLRWLTPFVVVVGLVLSLIYVAEAAPMATLTLKSSEALPAFSKLMYASYLKPTGVEMIRLGEYSPDNGRSWQALPLVPEFDRNLPHGYRRESFPLFVDYSNGRIVRIVPSMDTEGLDPNIEEPPIALEAYYLRYRVSLDGGRTWLFDEIVVQNGYTPENPLEASFVAATVFLWAMWVPCSSGHGRAKFSCRRRRVCWGRRGSCSIPAADGPIRM